MTTADSDKDFKRREHRRARAIERDAIRAGREDELHPKQTGNPWASEKDGKQWVDTDCYPEILRK